MTNNETKRAPQYRLTAKRRGRIEVWVITPSTDILYARCKTIEEIWEAFEESEVKLPTGRGPAELVRIEPIWTHPPHRQPGGIG